MGYIIVSATFLGLLSMVTLLMGIEVENSEKQLLLEGSFVALPGSFLTVYLFRKFSDQKTFISLGYNIGGRFKDILIGLLIGFLIIGAGFLFVLMSGGIEFIGYVFDLQPFLISFLLCLVIAFSEEIVFRGYLLNIFMESMNKYYALLFSAILFALMHCVNPNFNFIGFVNIFLAGLLLGLPYVYTRNLWYSVSLHFAWNFFQGPIFGFHVSGMSFKNSILKNEFMESSLINGGEFGLEGSVIVTILSIIGIGVIYLYYKPT